MVRWVQIIDGGIAFETVYMQEAINHLHPAIPQLAQGQGGENYLLKTNSEQSTSKALLKNVLYTLVYKKKFMLAPDAQDCCPLSKMHSKHCLQDIFVSPL